jgi:NADH dehydrogenase
MLRHGAEQIDESGIVVDGQRIAARTVIWAAGAVPSPAGGWLAAETDRAGRVRVETDLTVPVYPEIYVFGDIARLEQDGKALPGLAQRNSFLSARPT